MIILQQLKINLEMKFKSINKIFNKWSKINQMIRKNRAFFNNQLKPSKFKKNQKSILLNFHHRLNKNKILKIKKKF